MALSTPEIIIGCGVLAVLLLGLFLRRHKKSVAVTSLATLIILSISLFFIFLQWPTTTTSVWGGMLKHDNLTAFFKILFDSAAILTVCMTWRANRQLYSSEYFAVLLAVVLGAHLLVTSTNFIMVFLSLEMISIGAYILTGFSFNKKGAEGSLKYFLFGSVASAVMLYGFSILYGITGTLGFANESFIHQLTAQPSTLTLTATLMVAAGLLYKIAAAPMHVWSPDVYEAAPMPIVAFFSVVPKLAGIGALINFLEVVKSAGHTHFDWQLVISVVAIATLTIGNFSALLQKNVKRLMAYSSIAQSGFLLIAVASFLPKGIHVLLFYASVYMVANFIIFIFLQYYESKNVHTIAGFSGLGKTMVWPIIIMSVALLTLTGLPPTAGLTAKIFIFSSLWEAYALTGKTVLLVLFVFGLLNTVVSLFYYLRIPYYAFLKEGDIDLKQNKTTFENLLGLIMVVVILILFFLPGLLMGWINKINFVF